MLNWQLKLQIAHSVVYLPEYKKLAQFHIYQIVGHQNLNFYIWGVGQVLRYIDLKVYLILNTVTLVAICIIQRGLVKT